MIIQGSRIAVLATNGFEESELFEPVVAFEEGGALVDIVSLKSGIIRGWKDDHWGRAVQINVVLSDAQPETYDLLFLPGGVMSPDRLRMDPLTVLFVKSFFDLGKPVAAICHGVQLLIDADVLRGRTVTSWPSLKRDLENAGAQWIDSHVVDDNKLITSRKPSDFPEFIEKIVLELSHSRADPSLPPSFQGRRPKGVGLTHEY